MHPACGTRVQAIKAPDTSRKVDLQGVTRNALCFAHPFAQATLFAIVLVDDNSKQ